MTLLTNDQPLHKHFQWLRADLAMRQLILSLIAPIMEPLLNTVLIIIFPPFFVFPYGNILILLPLDTPLTF